MKQLALACVLLCAALGTAQSPKYGITKKVRSGTAVTYHDSDRQEGVPGFRQL